MTVYVDDMRRPAKIGTSRHARWSHLFADTSEELRAAATNLGLKESWLQRGGTYREHYDVTDTVRLAAIKAGAQQISYPRGTADLLQRKRSAETTHLIADGEAVTLCCGRTPFELPRTDRLTVDPTRRNCH